MTIPTPDYDSDWFVLNQNETVNKTHNLGTYDLLVDVMVRYPGPHPPASDSYPPLFYQPYNRYLFQGWRLIDENTIRVENWEARNFQYRVRIWKHPT